MKMTNNFDTMWHVLQSNSVELVNVRILVYLLATILFMGFGAISFLFFQNLGRKKPKLKERDLFCLLSQDEWSSSLVLFCRWNPTDFY